MGAAGAIDAKYTISYDGGSDVVMVNQQEPSGMWYLLGEYPVNLDDVMGERLTVTISDEATGDVVMDAVRFVCTNCTDDPTAVYKHYAYDTYTHFGTAPMADWKNVWGVRGGSDLAGLTASEIQKVK